MKITTKHKQLRQSSSDFTFCRTFITIGFLLFCLMPTISTLKAENNTNLRTVSFDQGWRFSKTDLAGAENSAFDDSNWRLLDLPHDWSIEDLPNQTKDSISGPFSKAAASKMASGYTVGGTAWYRKNFTINRESQGKTAYLQFDGVYMNSDVWVNGKHLGNYPYGYTSFWYDITPYLNLTGQPNIVAVQVKNEAISCRW